LNKYPCENLTIKNFKFNRRPLGTTNLCLQLQKKTECKKQGLIDPIIKIILYSTKRSKKERKRNQKSPLKANIKHTYPKIPS